jgi:hypothetical protein
VLQPAFPGDGFSALERERLVFFSFALAAAASTACAFIPQLQLTPSVSQIHVVRATRSYTASASLTLSVHTLMKSAPANDAGLRAHVAGYYAIARTLAQTSTLRAIGGSESQARARLAKAVAALVRDANAEYLRQMRIYDTVTENGRAQSQGPAYGFPGGPNANVYCIR